MNARDLLRDTGFTIYENADVPPNQVIIGPDAHGNWHAWTLHPELRVPVPHRLTPDEVNQYGLDQEHDA